MEPAGDLLFDLEEADYCQTIAANESSESVSSEVEVLARRLELATRQPSALARRLNNDVITLIKDIRNGPTNNFVVRTLAPQLANLGYAVSIRAALGGGSDCFKNLRHEFLVVRGTGEFTGMEFIVEPFLRQHFTIPHPSHEYAFVLSRTPDVFVGGSCRLVPVVQLLCSLMAASFQQQGLPLPPWRKEAAMLSKWLPSASRARDEPLVSVCDLTAQSHRPSQATIPVGGPPQPHAVSRAAGMQQGPVKGPANIWSPVSVFTAVLADGKLSGPSAAHPHPIAGPAAPSLRPIPGPIVAVTGFHVAGEPVSRTAQKWGSKCGTADDYDDETSLRLQLSGDCDCASPAAGEISLQDSGSVMLGSSCERSPLVGGGICLLESPAAGGGKLRHEDELEDESDADSVIDLGCMVTLQSSKATTKRRNHRRAGTGMLPTDYPTVGMLATKIMLLDGAEMATAAATVQGAKMDRQAAASWLETRTGAHPDAPSIHLVRMKWPAPISTTDAVQPQQHSRRATADEAREPSWLPWDCRQRNK